MRLSWLVIFASGFAAGQSHPSWWGLASPEATALVGIQWDALKHSPFGDAVGEELGPKGSLGFPDLPCIQDSQQILISAPAILAIASGSFPSDTLRKQAATKGLKPAHYHGIDLWISPGKDTLSVAQLSEQLLLIGLRKTLEAAIDRNVAESGRQYSPLLARAARFARTKDLWAVANRLPDPLASVFVPLETEAQGFEGGVAVRDGLQLDATVESSSYQAAAATVEGIRKLIRTSPGAAGSLQVSVAGAVVSVSLQWNRDELAANLRPAEPAPVSQSVVAAPAPAPPAPRVIRIFGLDEGPREILLPPVLPNQ